MGTGITYFDQAYDYSVDGLQRSILFFDLLRQRGNAANEQEACSAPNVLNFKSELMIDGRDLPCPVNYMLLRILPEGDVRTDFSKRPFVVFDPRAGQGPGVGGMKKESEVGIALAKGHPVYFVSFLVHPVLGQTVQDVCEAEAKFIKEIIRLHPDAEKPCLIGNCQAGWQIAMMSALYPELAGVLILAATPLSYWAGKRGESVGRYAAGMTGGSWINSFLSDMGNGLFDGAWLVSSFEGNNPAHAFWDKSYGLYTKVDTEGPRYLSFERWWGSPTLLEAQEIQFISDELFIGNNLSQAKIHDADGVRVDLRNIKAPILIFCSRGDDISPPAQALGWIDELYEKDEDIIAGGQTIIYCMHEDVGHLGIFVSSSIANKEHQKFISNIDFIESLPPGLYEAKMLHKEGNNEQAALIGDDYILRFERRCLKDVRAFGVNDEEDNQRFETVARLSENIYGIYSTFISPWVQQLVTEDTAEMLRHFHPVRIPYWAMSDKNPLCSNLEEMSSQVRHARTPVNEDNMFLALQNNFAKALTQMLGAMNDMKNETIEECFHQFYGNPILQAMLGVRTAHPYAAPIPARDVFVEAARLAHKESVMAKISEGSMVDAMIRGLVYVSRAENAVDEREYLMLKKLLAESDLIPDISIKEFKDKVRLQHTLLYWDQNRAIRALPQMLKGTGDKGAGALATIHNVVNASGVPTEKEEMRLKALGKIFG